MITISFLTVVKNEEKYIAELLSSILSFNNKFFTCEIVIVDDNSDDDTHRIIKSFQDFHSNIKYFKNSEDGDLYSRQVSELRVDLPINYANTSMSSWMYINPAYIIPEPSIKILHESLKFGIFDLTSIKLTGSSCLTPNFGITPQGYNGPVDVLNDDSQFPPLENPDYYDKNKYYYKKHGMGENMYCSANTNYVAMPKNHSKTVKGLDTSFQVSVGNNSLSIGVVMSPNLKSFIINELYNFNLLQCNLAASDNYSRRN